MGETIKSDILQKTVGVAERDPFYEYFLALTASFLPWVLVAAYKTRTQIKNLFHHKETSYFGYAFLVPLIILSCFSVKHSKYLLPLFPFFGVFLGIWTSNLFEHLSKRRGNDLERHLVWIATTLVMGFFLYYSVVEKRVLKYRYEAFQPVVAKLRKFPDTPIYSFRQIPNQLVYYYGRPLPVVQRKEVEEMVSQNKPFLLIAENRDWKVLESENLQIVMQYQPYLKKERGVRILATAQKNGPEES